MKIEKSSLAFSFFALGILGVSGVGMNFIIAKFYDLAILGSFNLQMAIFLVASQFATAGIQFSVLQKVSAAGEDESRKQSLFASAICGVLISSLITISLLLAMSYWLELWFKDPGLQESLKTISWALVFFSLNKVCFAYLNATLKMKTLAAAQIVRGLGFLSICGILALTREPADRLSLIFLITEAIVFSFCFFSLRSSLFKKILNLHSGELFNHFHFGLKGFASGALIELNARVDILLLSFFLPKDKVGLYAMAALIVEGYSQILVTVKSFLNPVISKYSGKNNLDPLAETISKLRPQIYGYLFAVGVLTIIGFFFFQKIVYDGTLIESVYVMSMLLFGCWLSSGFVPFDGILIQLGNPGTQSLYVLLCVATNLSLNLILVPKFGLFGAGVATAIAFSLTPFFLVILSKKSLGRNLFW